MRKQFITISIIIIAITSLFITDKNSNITLDTAVYEKQDINFDWNDEKIEPIDLFPNFGKAPIVEYENYYYYVKRGNIITRVNRSNNSTEEIIKIKKKKVPDNGVHTCMGEDGIFFEYSGNIFYLSHYGTPVRRIISNKALRKQLEPSIEDMDHDCEISAIEFYKGRLYFFARGNVYKLDLDTLDVSLLAKYVREACFCKNRMYYTNNPGTVMYMMDLERYKKKRIRWGPTSLSDVKSSDQMKYYRALTSVNGQFYYVRLTNKEGATIYKYNKRGQDGVVYHFDVGLPYMRDFPNFQNYIACEYRDSTGELIELEIYDLIANQSTSAELPLTRKGMGFCYLVENALFYNMSYKDKYLMCYYYD